MNDRIDRLLVNGSRLFLRRWPWRLGRGSVYKHARRAAERIGPVRARTRAGAVMLCDGRDLTQRSVLFFGVWEPALTALVERTLRPGDVFVDVGANVGYFTLLAAQRVGPEGHCVSVEAAPATAARLRENVALNRFDTVRIVEMAAAARRNRLTLYLGDERNTGASTLLATRRYARSAEVEAAPLTEILSEDEIGRAKMVKIDVEGAESEALEPVFGALDRFREDVVFAVEYAPEELRRRGTSLAGQVERFARAGFRAHLLEIDHPSYDYLRESEAPPPAPVAMEALSAAQRDFIEARPHVDVMFSRRPPA